MICFCDLLDLGLQFLQLPGEPLRNPPRRFHRCLVAPLPVVVDHLVDDVRRQLRTQARITDVDHLRPRHQRHLQIALQRAHHACPHAWVVQRAMRAWRNTGKVRIVRQVHLARHRVQQRVALQNRNFGVDLGLRVVAVIGARVQLVFVGRPIVYLDGARCLIQLGLGIRLVRAVARTQTPRPGSAASAACAGSPTPRSTRCRRPRTPGRAAGQASSLAGGTVSSGDPFLQVYSTRLTSRKQIVPSRLLCLPRFGTDLRRRSWLDFRFDRKSTRLSALHCNWTICRRP